MSSRRRKTLSPSLFPFLAVLVCTLGTLILLLALVSQNAATAATQQAEAKANQAQKAAAEAERLAKEAAKESEKAPRMSGVAAASLIAEEAFRVQELVSFRDQQTADMERRRGELAQVESHMRRLKEELKQLSDQADIATGETNADAVDSDRLARLRKKVKDEAERLKKLAADDSLKAPQVALIPHKGPNGTDRRPVYLECTASGMTIWPEGSTLTVSHLEESVSGANPLDEALKIVRHHVLQNYGDEVPPYPLLVVRPDGIDTYAAARIALQDWDDQFGYELVPDEVNLAYGTPDDSLKRRVDEAIRAAVIRQHGLTALAQRAKRGYRQSGAIEGNKRYPRLSAAAMDRRGRSNGFSDHRDGLNGRVPYGSSSPMQGGGAIPGGQRGGAMGGASGADIAQTLDQHLRDAAGQGQQAGVSPNPYSGPSSASRPGGTGDAGQTGQPDASAPSLSAAAAKTANPEAGTALAALADNMPTSSLPQRIRPNQFVDPSLVRDGMLERQANPYTMPSGMAGGPSDQATDQRGGSSADPFDQAGQSGRAGQLSPSGGRPSDLAMRPPSNTGRDTNRSPSNFQMPPADSQSPGRPSAGAPSQSLSMNQIPNQSHDELARQAELQQRAAEDAMANASVDRSQNSQRSNSRQQNAPPPSGVNMSASREMVRRDRDKWALPRNVAGSRGNSIVRTIRVQCYPDRLVLVSSPHDGGTEMFGVADDDMNRATLELASAVRDRIELWGATMPGGRWQPRLDVEVMDGGENRYYQLQRLMSGSGVDVVGRHSETSPAGADQ